jgi:demethylmenaquinone methyltransferase/2-methoxy-6-polyprenyl-1,4-benzoquinol methylase
VIGERTEHARRLFAGIAGVYDAPAGAFSFWQYPRWRHALVRQLRLSLDDLVLDAATGTGAIARDIARRYGSRVLALDQVPQMLAEARSRGVRRLVGGQAERLPFPDESFDAVVFSYLLRYVEDPAATLRELARALRPGGTIGSVEFGVPRGRIRRLLWSTYAFGVFPYLARLVSPGWRDVGAFLPGSIVAWSERMPPARLAELWRAAGIENVRWKEPSLGAGVVMWGRKRGA